ncbi:HEAT repeat domain-containing protein [Longimicrobium sp.]|uniref:HEAT repeat domain-containing protein n=1 Tax=Longimicrobium sp. TaxID=2029185 RepID=UPI003B3ACE0B
MSETALRAAAWLLTYALHSTLLLGAAALLARRVRGEAWRETLWKAALIGGIVTATAQTQSGYDPPAGTWRLGSTVAFTAVLPAEEAASAQPSPAIHTPGGAAPRPASIESTASTEPAPPSTPAAVSTGHVESTGALSIRPLMSLAIGAWAMIAALLIVRIAWRQGRLRRMLRGRQAVSDPAVVGMMAELRRNAGLGRPVRLTACDATPTPLALGGGEVCVPPRFLVDLDPEQQRSALAHELAHLARRDPAWHFVIALIEAVFFFQPLNRLARLRLRESAEFLCDEWAARQTGSPLGLARCLAEVASWVAPGRPPIPAGTMAMAEGGSPVVQRVQRLTTWRGGSHEGNGVTRIGGAVLLVLAIAAAAPAVASSGEGKPEAAAVDPRVGVEPEQAAAVDDDTLRRQTAGHDGIIRHPRPAEPLARRWAWAVEEMESRRMARAWVAWSAPAPLSAGPTWIANAPGTDHVTVNQRLGAPAEHMVLLAAVARNGQVEYVMGHGALVELGRQPIVWLGAATDEESFAQLRGVADELRDPEYREAVMEVVGMHDAAGVVPYLAAVLGRDGSNGVRREAATALGRHRGDEALSALETAVERDGAKDVRREAVEAIGRMGHPRSPAVLREIATSAQDSGTRRDAVEALGPAGSVESLESLRRIALTETDAKVARQAVESMEQYPAAQATPVLKQIAFQRERAEAAKQAAESLGRFPYQWTLSALDSIARTHPDRSVALQAVESLGGYRDAYVDTYLSVIAARTRAPAVAEEARDQIRSHVTRQGNRPPPPGPPPNVRRAPRRSPNARPAVPGGRAVLPAHRYRPHSPDPPGGGLSWPLP